MGNFKQRIKAIERLVAAAAGAGCLPDLPKPWAEMTEQEMTDFINQFI